MKPDFRVIADGEDVTAQIRDRANSITITDNAGYKSDSAEIVLDDRDGIIEIPKNGAELVIALGYVGALVEMGRYVTDEVTISTAAQTLSIRAKAPDMEGTIKEQKTRGWDNKSVRQIVTTIAGEHNLKPAISAAHAGFVYKHLAQQDESDMNLLTRIARDHDAIAAVKDGRLLFSRKGAGETIDGKPMPVHQISRGQITSYRATLAGRAKFKSVIASYHDKKRASKLEARAGEGQPAHRIRHIYPNKDQAEKAAKAYYDEKKRAASTLSLVMPGRPEIGAEARLILMGVRKGVDGLWSIKSANHKYDRNGLTTTIEAEEPNEGRNQPQQEA
jgi:phage protein D